ncbi:MAG: ABC transporter permease [Bdellovibrio sp.]|nr:ABC transporter permease [Bdellovibrio sp.]
MKKRIFIQNSCLLWLVLWYLVAVFIFIIKQDISFDLSLNLLSPTLSHPFGFDAFGRDLLLVAGEASLISSFFAFSVVCFSFFIGITCGMSLAVMPGFLQIILLRSLDFLLAFPSLLLSLAFAALWGPGWGTLIVSLLIGSLPGFIRFVYVRTRELLLEDYVKASVALGSNIFWILIRHVLPRVLSFCLVKLPNVFSHILLAEATLSFLGVGAPVGANTWGSLLLQGKDYLLEAPHVSIVSGLPLFFTVLSLQLLSEEK